MNYEVNDFNKDVLQASYSLPVIVDFWAEWCGPCKVLGPIIEKLAAENKGEWKLVKVNSDEYPEISSQYGIRSIPNVKLFFKGEVINEFVGALPEKAIRDWLTKNIPNKNKDLLLHAESLLATGNTLDAEAILKEVLETDSKNQTAKILLAKSWIFSHPAESLKLLTDSETENEYVEQIDSIRTLCNLFVSDLKKELEETPTKSVFMEAVEYLKNKQFELSLEKFIHVIRTDRFYNDDGARKVCIAIFKYLGEENPITLAYRRDFGRALYI
ncbi:MAG: thioredoxin [Ignavibacteriaceae bacterium]|nr:thioredoxin [Ignavibacteriaceae bacterium]